MEVKACGFLVVRGRPIDSFLLMQHKNRLDLPKGHLDEGETELECAYRELEEETGIRCDQIELFPDFRFTLQYSIHEKRYGNQKVDKTLVIFLGRLLADVPIQTTEHLGYEWRRWNPPHRIQAQTIDPLLAAAEAFFVRNDGSA
jgi:8-oxo-dGTP pyrophosphatase MutT (NUDIX family)